MRTITRLSALLLVIAALAASCKKASVEDLAQNQQVDLVVLAMTNGTWEMTWYKENNVDMPDFIGYEFKYYSDYTVDAIKNGTATRGNWGGNATNMTTSALFPPAAGNPLLKLNGTWNITRNSWTYVEARQELGGMVKTMRLDKK